MAGEVEIRVSLKDVDNAILEGIDNSRELRRVYYDFIDDVEETWKRMWEASGPHPYETGDYIAHLKKKVPGRGKWIKKFLKAGIPFGAVYNDHELAHIIEYGSGPDNPDSASPFGPDTPTPAFQPMLMTWARYGG
ncbi:hypothetical protein JRC04_04840 [Mycolicibacterium sp. S2-37]|uniref:hypothetical protein n=1 Tax=Mycolicibacterium sp. S2-37 TaxID=2810297 RepID=UPI001A93F34D|nr:hypothetical protein [Mycolicibacterium sp. S2-37]MBO0676786.1 hypothetical protein [Mycolicibacterium sp. S2-37]